MSEIIDTRQQVQAHTGKSGAGQGGPNPEAISLLERFGAQMLATARRYSASPHDAEDAYQRATEILLTHRPTGTEEELCRWLRTTTKHEALAINRHRARVVPTGESASVPQPSGGSPDAYDHAERFERLHHGAQALGRLKPQEMRCLLLKAEGYSYVEICGITGFTYTKVNRPKEPDEVGRASSKLFAPAL
ncbi:MAG TPA: sigma-70 family RNA polymerase sigma factor [Thermoleophilaceae bacterium]|nr:sigma-70 family RNA polymerase sigma factor [Thermoleophilaceae bacterium]